MTPFHALQIRQFCHDALGAIRDGYGPMATECVRRVLDVLKRAAEEPEARSAMPAGVWISVKDDLPEDNVPVLWCRAPVCEPYVVACICSDEWSTEFTHWMPLPEGPADA